MSQNESGLRLKLDLFDAIVLASSERFKPCAHNCQTRAGQWRKTFARAW